MNNITIENAVYSIKEMIERAIKEGGVEGKNNLTSNPQAISMAISIAVKSLNTMHHDSMSVNFDKNENTFPLNQNAT